MRRLLVILLPIIGLGIIAFITRSVPKLDLPPALTMFEAVWEFLGDNSGQFEALGVIAGALTFIWGGLKLIPIWRSNHQTQAEILPLEAVTWQQLRGELVRGGQITWVDRGDTDVNLLRAKERIAITGQRKLGKTREAIELIRRMVSGRNAIVFRPSVELDRVPITELELLVSRQLRGFSLCILFVDDLPFWYKGASLKRLGTLWEIFQKSSPQTYFIATVRPDQTEGEHHDWLEQNDIYRCSISRLNQSQTAEFVANALHVFNMTANDAAYDAFTQNNDGTPERPLNVLRLLEDQNVSQLEEKQVDRLMQDEISVTWAENRKRIREQNVLAGKIVDALAIFHAARFRPDTRLLSAYVVTQGRFPKWAPGLKRAWQLLSSGFDIDNSEQYVHYPDIAVEGLVAQDAAISDIHNWVAKSKDSWHFIALIFYKVDRLGIFQSAYKPSKQPRLKLWLRKFITLVLRNNSGSHNTLGNAYNELNQTDKAIIAYKKSISLDPNYATPHCNLGLMYWYLGLTQDAIVSYENTIAIDPNFAAAYNNLGYIYHNIDQTEKAISFCNKAIALNPNSSLPHLTLAAVYQSLDDLQKFELHCQKASQFITDEHEYNRSRYGAICGNNEEAINLLQIAIDKKPAYRELARRDLDFHCIRNDPRFQELINPSR